jgi:S1-C subfamily serine protease
MEAVMDSGFPQVPVVSTRTLLVLVMLVASSLLALLVVGGRWSVTGPSSAVALLPGDGSGRAVAAVPADEIYRRAVDGVVKIEAFDVWTGRYAAAPGEAGSGFVAARDGRIVTCAHVVSPAGKVATRVRVVFRAGEVGERSVDGAVVGVDAVNDLAVVRVDPETVRLTALPLGDSSRLEVGDAVYALGNALDYDFSMTRGIVSALHRVLVGPDEATIRDCIQHDAAVNAGDSGGPLLDERGAVIGVNERIATPDGAPVGNVGLAFAVPVGTVRDVLGQLEAGGEVVRPWVGVEALTISPAAVRLLDPGVDRGLLLVDVTPGGPAAAAGLRGGDRVVAVPGQPGRTVAAGGDVVTALDGRPVDCTDDLVSCVQGHRPGDRLTATYVRDGRTATVVIVVGVRP